MQTLSRRAFVQRVAVAGGVVGFPAIIPSTVLGKNDQTSPSERANIGMIGCGSITKYADPALVKNPKAQLIAVCDPNPERRLKKKQTVNELYAKRQGKVTYHGCKAYSDFRDLLANPDVDGVYIATGDYWHVPMSILAAKAGKDLHTEKPLGLCINQCLAMEKATRKYERIFQYGTEGRSMAHPRLALQLVLNGHIGEVKKMYVWCPHGEAGNQDDHQPIPEGFDYDLWLGPAPEVPFCANRSLRQGHRNGIFHIYDYAIGFIAGWGAHPMDLAQWWADNVKRGIPVDYEGTGVIPTEGLFDTITHWNTTCTYEDGLTMRFADSITIKEVLAKEENMADLDRLWRHGVIFVGADGRRVHLARNACTTRPTELWRKAKDPGAIKLIKSIDHQGNWIDAMLSQEQPVSDVHSAVQSDIICHLCDIAIRTGRKIKWDPRKETIPGDESAKAMMSRPMRKPWTIDV